MVKKAKEEVRNYSVKQKSIYRFLILAAIVVVVNLMADIKYKRFDLTKEKRYTLSKATHDLVDKLDETVYIQIFLDGEFPAEYKRLQNATRDLMQEYENISGGNIEFKFDDVLSDRNEKERNDIRRQLREKGLMVTNPVNTEEGKIMESAIIPGALVHYKGAEYPLNLLQFRTGRSLDENINASIEQLEYEIGNALRKCVTGKEIRIGFTQGHGELDGIDMADIGKSLDEFYNASTININLDDTNCTKPFLSKLQANPENAGAILLKSLMDELNDYSLLVVAKPRKNFKNEELLLLDQYVMNGGKVIWLIDPVIAEYDSLLVYNGEITPVAHEQNIGDLLFRYGLRVNYDLIQDMNCHVIPILSQTNGQIVVPWLYYPLFTTNNNHPISRNVGNVWGQFVSSIDTLPNIYQHRTVLLSSSEFSRVAPMQVPVSLAITQQKIDPKYFTKPFQAAAVLAQGRFKSLFANRPLMEKASPFKLKNEVENNSMIVISDGDLIRNQTGNERKQIMPLGFDKYASKAMNSYVEFANKNFFLNCVDYLCDSSNIIEVRNKRIELRLLDKGKVKNEKGKWQTINMVVPIVVLAIFGFINFWIRRRKYAR
ncbi:MAG: gliding motility-associated ABC transporter substrate-binding protein GldG [Flavobacteriales bacterium]|nr:gliding motility-associated ABC transporter substrate-binding protein GldG [Flavobacteriales bacterium]